MNKRNIKLFILLFIAIITMITFVSCNTTDNSINDMEQEASYEGKIIDMVDNNNFTIRVNNSTDLISLSIGDEINFGKDVINKFAYGNTIGIITGPEIMESWPLQVILHKVYKNEPPSYIKINQDIAKTLMDTQEVITLDVRTEVEFNEGHIENAILLPLDQIEKKAETILQNKNMTILIYCRSGNRSKSASEKLIDMGYTNVYDFGGINTWQYELIK